MERRLLLDKRRRITERGGRLGVDYWRMDVRKIYKQPQKNVTLERKTGQGGDGEVKMIKVCAHMNLPR